MNATIHTKTYTETQTRTYQEKTATTSESALPSKADHSSTIKVDTQVLKVVAVAAAVIFLAPLAVPVVGAVIAFTAFVVLPAALPVLPILLLGAAVIAMSKSSHSSSNTFSFRQIFHWNKPYPKHAARREGCRKATVSNHRRQKPGRPALTGNRCGAIVPTRRAYSTPMPVRV
jgi:hypothetical protein